MIHRDGDGFYRPAGSSSGPYLQLPFQRSHHILDPTDANDLDSLARQSDYRHRVSSLNSTATTATLVEDNTHHADVFGRLIGMPYLRALHSDDALRARYSGIAPRHSVSHPDGFQTLKKHGSASDLQEGPTISSTAIVDDPSMTTPIKERADPMNEGDQSPLRKVSRDVEGTNDQSTPKAGSPFGKGVRHPSSARTKQRGGLASASPPAILPFVPPLDGTSSGDKPTKFVLTDEDAASRTLALDDVSDRYLRETASTETIRRNDFGNGLSMESALARQQDSQLTPMQDHNTKGNSYFLQDTRIYDVFEQLGEREFKPKSESSRSSLNVTSDEQNRHEVR